MDFVSFASLIVGNEDGFLVALSFHLKCEMHAWKVKDMFVFCVGLGKSVAKKEEQEECCLHYFGYATVSKHKRNMECFVDGSAEKKRERDLFVLQICYN